MTNDAERRRSALHAVGLGGVALLILGVALFALWPATVGPPRLAGGNLPIDPAATDPRQIPANNSPSLTRNPAHPDQLAVVNRVDSPAFTCALHLSGDGGATWQPSALPFPAGEEQPARCFAPDAAFGAGGRLYVSFVTLKGAGNVPNALWLTDSADGGRTFALPRRVWGPLAFGARLVADPTQPATVALVWLQAGETATLGFATTDNPLLVARSDDGGVNWKGPFRLTPPSRHRALAASIAADAHGLYVAYLDLGDDVLDYSGAHGGRAGPAYLGRWTLVLARSGDGGATWSEVDVDSIVPATRIVVLFPPTPSLAVDGADGRVYVSMADARGGDADVWLWASADGRSFGPPVRVNDTPPADGTSQYLPAIAVSPGGRLDVLYYDRRRDPGADALDDVSFQSSTDHGRSFGRSVRLTDRSFDAGIGFGSERGLADLGSRLALVSSRGRSLALWADTRAGTVASGKQDLTKAVVAFDTSPGTGRTVGAALAGLGLAALAGWAAVTLSRWRNAPEPTGPQDAGAGSGALEE